MNRYYVNLLGEWTDITDDGLVENYKASDYIRENLSSKDAAAEYINITYKECSYKVHPACIQILTK